jgi:hypothetical protein
VVGIVLNQIYHEWELKRKIYVDLPVADGVTQQICIEPDASLDFTTPSIEEETPSWRDFSHIEVYRTLPAMEQQFKQKIQGYVVYAQSLLHQQLFHTAALSIAIFARTDEIAKTLRKWTQEALVTQPDEGDRFFFTDLNPATAIPGELFLSPVWQQAFREDTIPLLDLEAEADHEQPGELTKGQQTE